VAYQQQHLTLQGKDLFHRPEIPEIEGTPGRPV
jgi:hypothetical protein